MQLSELVVLMVAVSVAPLVWAVRQRTSVLRASPWWLVSYGCVLVAYVATIAEGVGGTLGEWLNALEHFSLLAAGAGFLLFARELFLHSRQANT